MKNLEKEVYKEELNEMALLRELKWSKENLERLQYENKLLQQKAEEIFYYPGREAGTSP